MRFFRSVAHGAVLCASLAACGGCKSSVPSPAATVDAGRVEDAGPASMRDSSAPTQSDAAQDGGGSYALITRGGPLCPGPSDRTCLRSAYTGWGLAYEEEPRYEDDYVSASGYERTLTVTARQGLSLQAGLWGTQYEVKSDRPSKGGLAFYVTEPHAVLDQALPDSVHMLRTGLSTDCLLGGPELQGARLGGTTLRDTAGLVLAASGGGPLRPDGSAMMVSNDDLGFTLRWKDAGCAPCTSTAAQSGGLASARYVSRTVAIEFTLTGDGTTRSMLPGEPQSFERDGIKYIFVVDNAELPVVEGPGTFCGSVGWTLYRDGMLVELNPDGTRKK